MKNMWLLKVAGVLLVALLVQGCMVRATDYRRLENQLAFVQAEIDGYQTSSVNSRDELEELQIQYDRVKLMLESREDQILNFESAPKATPELIAIWDRLEILARDRKDVKWDSRGRKLLVSVEFDLGSSAVRPSGKASIKQIAAVLRGMPSGYVAYIDGHTDDLPVKNPRTVAKHRDNPTLASHRALAVYRVLAEGGVPPKLMISRSFGPYYPIVSNDDERSRARNRRVEISVVPANAAFTPTAMLVPESDVVAK